LAVRWTERCGWGEARMDPRKWLVLADLASGNWTAGCCDPPGWISTSGG